ncbi:MAG: peptidylprolyl isomerase [Oscillospiraceae bacterium]|nr:peptidylprolyl isomerase [Oscillospiraceae bacterium]
MKNTKIIGIIIGVLIIILIALLVFLWAFGAFRISSGEELPPEISETENINPGNNTEWQKTETSGDKTALFKTEKGDFEIKLADCETAEKFEELNASGAFEGATFLILAENLFIQSGTCGEAFAAEENEMECIRGAVGFIRDGDEVYPSIVIITGEDLSEALDGRLSVFGQVVSGMETVDEIAYSENKGYTAGYSAVEPILITGIEIS